MNVLFRTDASLEIGSGHVMRCLSLASALRDRGAGCRFVCREHPGHLMELIRQSGFEVHALPFNEAVAASPSESGAQQAEYLSWLGAEWQSDATQTLDALGGEAADWLVVDHYSLGIDWERTLRGACRQLMVIDDLGRAHDCDILLDQNMVEGMEARYRSRVPAHCRCLLGPEFALLRPEFGRLREQSLARRDSPTCNRLLVFMGGSDPENETARVIEGVTLSERQWHHVDVVVGQGYQPVDRLRARLELLPSAHLHIQTQEMARLMADADLAVTAGGSVTWEKCVLGLPSLVTILGDNQGPIAEMMHRRGALRTLGQPADLSLADYAAALDDIWMAELQSMSAKAGAICDGTGTHQIGNILDSYQ